MIYQILNAIDNATKLPQAHAHCDIPCKIYDPVSVQLAALSVVRLIDIMTEALEAEPPCTWTTTGTSHPETPAPVPLTELVDWASSEARKLRTNTEAPVFALLMMANGE